MSELLQALAAELKEKNYRLFSILLYLVFLFFSTPIYIKFHSEMDTAHRVSLLFILFMLLLRLIPSLINHIKNRTLKAEDIFIVVILIGTVVGSFMTERTFDNHVANLSDIINNNYSATFFWNYITLPNNKIVFVAVLRFSYICISSKLLYTFLQTPDTSNDFFDSIYLEKIILQALSLMIYTVGFSLIASSQFLDKMFPL